MKTHSEEKQIICNQCNYASSKAGILRTHVKMHSGVTSKKCNQCHFKCSCLGMPYWHYQLKYLVGIFISQGHINQVCNNHRHHENKSPPPNQSISNNHNHKKWTLQGYQPNHDSIRVFWSPRKLLTQCFFVISTFLPQTFLLDLSNNQICVSCSQNKKRNVAVIMTKVEE